MKNKIITICVILAAILSFMSFATVLTQMNASDDGPDEVTTEAPKLKSFRFYYSDVSVTANYLTYYYYEGMTWNEFIDSEFNVDYGSGCFGTTYFQDDPTPLLGFGQSIVNGGFNEIVEEEYEGDDGNPVYPGPLKPVAQDFDSVIEYLYYY